MRRIGMFVMLALAVASCGPVLGAQPVKAASTAAANALFDEYWEWVLREYPTYATFLGDHRYDERVTDELPAAVARRRAYYQGLLHRLDRFDDRRLSAGERTSLGVLRFSIEKRVAIDKLFGSAPFGAFDDWAPVTQMNGIHLDLPQLVKVTRFASVKDYQNYIKRLDAPAGWSSTPEFTRSGGPASGPSTTCIPTQARPWNSLRRRSTATSSGRGRPTPTKWGN